MSEAAEHNAAGVAGGNAPAPETPAAFPNRLEVLRYLQAEGWQISQTQFYAHCREGRLPRQPDGGYLRRDADRYAKNHCRRLETGERVNDTLSRLAEKKAHLEVAREEIRLECDRHDLAVRRGEYSLDRKSVV